MEEWVHLVTVEGEYVPEQIRSLLRSEDVPFAEESVGNSEFLRIYLGGSFTKIDFLVKPRDLERARDLLANFEYPAADPEDR